MSVRNLVEEFSALEDPRCGGKVEHRLIDILVIAVCAVIAGAESWEDFALYGVAARFVQNRTLRKKFNELRVFHKRSRPCENSAGRYRRVAGIPLDALSR
jgi:hypothetical protein